ncbi:MAG TPA: hypothetical protein VHD56_08070 [Tepidisphaeraceae bacterium]|nr:hypothetical protein [Tepidisphaeraceae bacterium]
MSNRTSKLSVLCIVSLVTCALVGMAQTPATQPLRALRLRPNEEFIFQLPLIAKPVTMPGMDLITVSEMTAALAQVDRKVGDELTLLMEFSFAQGWSDNEVPGFRFYLTSNHATLDPSAVPNAIEFVSGKLKEQLKSSASLTVQQRTERIKANLAEEAAMNQKIMALSTLDAAQGNVSALLTERLKQLRETRQKLEMDLVNKESRRRALENAVAEQQKASATERDRDPVLNEMRKLVSLREEELKLKKAQFSTGIIPAAEGSAAEAQLSEAKIRLAEREAALGKAGKGELLDRLTDELVMISVDATDVQLQLAKVKDELATYDPHEMDVKRLDELMKRDSTIFDAGVKTSRLSNEFKNRIRQLQSERFALKTTDVSVTIDPTSSSDR